jgi:hypothetical protein
MEVCIQSAWKKRKMPAEICSARAGLYKSFSQNVCIFFFQEEGNIVEIFVSFNLSLSLFACVVCWWLKCSLSKHEILC